MTDSTVEIRAHFDGRFIVPDEPVNLPVNSPLKIEVKAAATIGKGDENGIALRLAALEKFAALGVKGAKISDENLRRENLYSDDGR